MVEEWIGEEEERELLRWYGGPVTVLGLGPWDIKRRVMKMVT